MIYLRTGGNGSCKTLFTLADIREAQLKESRPVAVNRRFKIKPHIAEEFGWRIIDFPDWEKEQDGTIFLIDECHYDLPLRGNGAPVPQHIARLSEHRARGFDFWLLTQHPMNIDAFVRRLVQAPGFHQHLKRKLGGSELTRVLQWDAVNPNCEKDGSGVGAQLSTRMHPKEVYNWYDSASLHTAKVKWPWQLKVFIAAVVSVPILAYFGWQAFRKAQPLAKTVAATAGPQTAISAPVGSTNTPERVQTPAEYVQSFVPRVEGLAYTASRYDKQTSPTTAPYPAACVKMASRCNCYTQQATKLEVPLATCEQIVKTGFFMDWQAGPTNAALPVSQSISPAQIAQAAPAPVAIGMQAAPVQK